MARNGFGSSDARAGSGRPAGEVTSATLMIPERCHAMCSWVVIRPGPGYACMSRLKYRNSLCSARLHVRQQEAARV